MIEINHLDIGYGKKILLKNISVTLKSGQLTVLLGSNGSGKTSLIKAIAGISVPWPSGHGNINRRPEIIVAGKEISELSRGEMARLVSYVGTERVRVGKLSCREVVAMGRAPWTGWFGRLGEEDERIVDRAIEMVGMSDFAQREMDGLSDGECQKILIARALAQNTPVMLLDEPTAFLDARGKYQTVEILRRVADQQGKCVLFSTHDVEMAMRVSDKILLLEQENTGRVLVLDAKAEGVDDKVFENLGVRR